MGFIEFECDNDDEFKRCELIWVNVHEWVGLKVGGQGVIECGCD